MGWDFSLPQDLRVPCYIVAEETLNGTGVSSEAFLKWPQPWASLRMGKVFDSQVKFPNLKHRHMDNLRV